MTVKKETFFNRLLIQLIISLSNFLNFLDFKLRNLFILLNVTVCAFLLMYYVKPMLDQSFFPEQLGSNLDIKKNIPENKVDGIPIKIETAPLKTLPEKKILIGDISSSLSARSVIVFDLNNEEILFEKDKLLTLPPASLVKMLSVMYFVKDIKPDEIYQTYSECNSVEGQKVGYKKNEKVSGKDLMYSSLVFSGGDSICNMYKITNTNIPDFNNFAQKLGMKNSIFTNFIGLDYPGNYTTSEDLLLMTREFIKNDYFNQIVLLKSYKMSNGKVLYNTNKMLFENEYAVGIKTGTTLGAKENLIYRHLDKKENLDLLLIILNSSSRYQDVKLILNSLRKN